jgi:hypothetical protein
MELKQEHTEHEENGTKVERDTYDDPDTEEIEIETTTDETKNNG